ncbi:MAG: response regulator [Halobacteriovoraceae bacterium]|nr:response regulator [Halobacteriovoraceae bacterium]MBT5095747.1 response regulator [Halobacteriovoraceae bacterium]
MKILVVDDMSTMRKIVSKMLRGMGFTNIEEADDGNPAWEMIQKAIEDGEPYEFIVSDWNMPGMSGLDLLDHVRANDKTKALKFLMVTAESERANIVIAIKKGVSNYVVKPFTPEIIKEKISKIFAA